MGIYSFMDEATYGLLSGIAPVVAQTDDYEVGGTPWQEQTLLTGRALGREEEAQELVDEVEARFAAVREENPEFDGATLAVDYGLVDGHYLLEEQDLRNRFFADLGFATPETTGEVSMERLDLLDQDVLVSGGYARKRSARIRSSLAGRGPGGPDGVLGRFETASPRRRSASAVRCPCRTCSTCSCRPSPRQRTATRPRGWSIRTPERPGQNG